MSNKERKRRPMERISRIIDTRSDDDDEES